MRWLTVLIVVIFISGCISVPGEETAKKEDDRDIVIKDLNAQIKKLDEEKESLKNQIEELKKEIEDLKKAETPKEEKKIEEIKSSIELSSWKRDDIIKAMSKYNENFINVSWFTFIYREDKHYYDQLGPIFDEDPFYGIRYKDRGEELKVNKLRMFNLNPGNATEAKYVYEDTYLPLISKETLIDSALKCSKKEECSSIKFIECTKNGNKHYSWFAAPYLMTTRDDNGESFEAFKAFYCP